MKAFLFFLLSKETANYLRWQWKRSKLTFFRIPWEWMKLILTRLQRKISNRNPAPFDLKADPAIRQPHFSNYWLQPGDIDPITRLAREQFSTEVTTLLQEAESICRGTFPLVSKINFSFLAGHWRPQTEDPEDLLNLNRWSFGMTLAKAWAYTQEPKYMNRFAALLEDWTKANPPQSGDAVWESYSVSERIVNWCFCATLFWNAPDYQSKSFPLLSKQLQRHAQWLQAHLEMEGAHNHLINNARALYTVGVFLNIQDPRALGWRLLEQELLRQVLPDGFLREQSVPYHLLLTRTYIEATLMASVAKETVSPEFTERVRKMVETAAAFLRPDGSCPLIGDVSPDIDLEALTGTIAPGQIHFHLPQSAPLREHGAWLARGAKADLSFETGSLFLPDAGYVITRTKEIHLVFHSDPRAEVVRHGHADALNLCLWQGGREILRDSGNFSYRFDSWWTYFHGSAGHNGISLAGLPCYPLTDFLSSLYPKEYRQAESGLEKPRIIDSWTCAAGWHSGYSRLGHRLVVRRRLILGPEYLWMTDRIEGQSRQRFEARWNLPPREISALSLIWLVNGSPTQVQWQKGWHSADYGTREASSVACLSGFHTDAVTRLDLLIGWGKPAPHKLVIAEQGRETVESSEWADVFDVSADGSRFEAHRRQIGAMV